MTRLDRRTTNRSTPGPSAQKPSAENKLRLETGTTSAFAGRPCHPGHGRVNWAYRRLFLAAEQARSAGKLPAATTARGLAYDFFRFVSRPRLALEPPRPPQSDPGTKRALDSRWFFTVIAPDDCRTTLSFFAAEPQALA